MKLNPDCIVCLFQQALRAAKLATSDERQHRQILDRLALALPEFGDTSVPVEVAQRIQQIVGAVTGVTDPYHSLKQHYNDVALALYPTLKQMQQRDADPLLTAIRLAIAGNIIDFGASTTFNLEQTIQDSLTWDFGICDYEIFLSRLEAAQSILYLGDNTGEIVFDKILVEEFLRRGKQVTFVVRGQAVINDATLEDARYVGLDQQVPVITSEVGMPGILLSAVGESLRSAFDQADLILAKGQGNFEGLSDAPYPITFLLKAKCDAIAHTLGVMPGAMIFYCPQR